MSKSNSKISLNLVLLTVTLLAHVPILIEYCIRMWRTGHYQFFPLVIAAVVYLILQNSDRIFFKLNCPGRPAIVSGLLLLVGGLVAVATLLNSSFLGAISFLLLTVTGIYWCSGKKGVVAGLPYLFILLFIVPLPLNLDQALIFKMQFIASHMASSILDAIGQIHFRQGVVLFTEQGSYLTEEACSGAKSLFSALTTIAIYGAINDYPWWRQTLNLVQTIFWVLIGNAIRIVIVIIVTDNWTPAIASGVGHELLGLAIYLFIVMMAISFDRIPNLWKRKLRNRTADNEPGMAVPSSTLKSAPRPVGTWALISIFLVLAVVGSRVAWVRYVGEGGIRVAFDRLPFLQQADLPVRLGNWTRSGFKHINRGKSHLEAEDSFVWKYENGDIAVKVSVDCPWDNWHDLSDCYHGLGWRGEPEHRFSLDQQADGFSKLQMSKPTGEEGIVFFSSVDRHGAPVVPKYTSGFFSVASLGRQISNNFFGAIGFSASATQSIKGIALPASTIQIVCLPNKQLSEEEVLQIQQFFNDARKQIVKSNRFRSVER